MEKIKVSVTVLTPPNEAEKAIEKQKVMLIGAGIRDNIVGQEVLSHDRFRWHFEIEEDKLFILTKRCAAGEVTIKRFYRTLFKNIRRLKKVSNKFVESTDWIIQRLKARIEKLYQHNEELKGMVSEISNMEENKLAEFISDKNMKEWDAFLKQDLIVVHSEDTSEKE